MYRMHSFANLRTALALVVICSALPVANAVDFQDDPYSARETYPTVALGSESEALDDPLDDIVVFDSRKQQIVPAVLTDLNKFSVVPHNDSYQAQFHVVAPLPEDPGVPVNLFVYLDLDGDTSNNAPAYGPGPESDAGVMLLFGTRTKWHTEVWKYDIGTKKWLKQPDEPAFTINGHDATVDLPASLGLKEGVTRLRAFSLTADEKGSFAEDIVPGEGLPALKKVEAAPVATQVKKPTESRNLFIMSIIGIMALLVVVGSTTIYIAQKRHHKMLGNK